MKFNLKDDDVTMAAGRPAAGQRPSERGIALVITLIMLSVTLIMAIAFLAVANRERATVTLSTDEANARAAADSALAAAQAQILANVLGTGGGNYNFGLLVSTNYINYTYGFVPGLVSPTNVNYDYYYNAPGPVGGVDFETVVGNLLYLPRAPVMVSATEPTGRFYLDLNRNGVFDFTGTNVPDVDYQFGQTNGYLFENGDPQWIGVLERPDALHSPDNHFIERYAFIVVPIGNGLDLNYIHNQVLNQNLNLAQDGYLRNQGVGPWEINLAAFLTDLNTNEWDPPTIENAFNNPYNYGQWQFPSFPNKGAGFEDAFSLLDWRYGFNYNTLAPANFYFNNSAPYAVSSIFPFDNIDEYSDGPLQIFTTNIDESIVGNQDKTSQPWAGADSTNRFFNLPAELFDPAKSSVNFVARLMNAGTNLAANGLLHPTYDRYTFYRLLSQLGTDSSADDDGRLDLNYDNTDGHGNVLRGVQTNLVRWTALAFFTNAADRLLRAYTTNWFQSNPTNYLATYYGITGYPFYIDPATGYGFTNSVLGTNTVPSFGITNIPVLIGGQVVYSPAVNRILQLAANIYDASTNSFYPSVFRPDFYRDPVSRNVFIDGYEQVFGVSGTSDPQLTTIKDLNFLLPGYTSTSAGDMSNVYGIPWILGAKKNLPNFNQFYMLNTVQLTRLLQVKRPQVEAWNRKTSADFSTNELFVMSVTNQIGYSLWNSYSNSYPGVAPAIYVNDTMTMTLSNSTYSLNLPFFSPFPTNFTTWPGSTWVLTTTPNARQVNANAFVISSTNFAFMQQSAYQFGALNFLPEAGPSPPTFDPTVVNLPVFPQMDLITTNWLQAYILDNGHVVDYVQYSGPNNIRNLNDELLDHPPTNTYTQMWVTNGKVMNLGAVNQIQFSQTRPPGGNNAYGWNPPPGQLPPGLPQLPQYEADYFKAFFTGQPFQDMGQTFYNNDLANQAPYTPTRTMYDLTLWQANDPLVHYLASDMIESNSYTGTHHTDDPVDNPPPIISQNQLGHGSSIIGDDRYQPWGRISQFALLNNVDQNAYNLAYRDPLVYSSDYWDFPTNRYPSVGWLGRVHRGTPWQTVYLKATNILSLSVSSPNPNPVSGLWTWMNWSGDLNSFDAQNSAPAQDDILFDIFTTALDDNASRGTLSVNQQNLAAWSAMLSGISVISNSTINPIWSNSPAQTSVIINPAGADTNSAVWQLVEGRNGINAVRASFPNGVFPHPADIVRVPALTQLSPFINTNNVNILNDRVDYDVSDEMYERIPQQILGLLRGGGTPRYVIYVYGQALRPAQDGTALDISHNGLVTNYQVVAESAARAVVSVHPQVTVTVSPTTGNYVPVTNYTTTVENYNPLPPN